MTEIEALERQAVVNMAKEWLGTPYHPNGDVKGAGVDCIRLIQRCFIDSNIITDFALPHYAPQWALHQTSELLIEGLLTYSHEIFELPQRGDVAVFRIGKCWGHSSIVVEWPVLIHANPPGSCRYVDALSNYPLARMTPRFFSVWPRG